MRADDLDQKELFGLGADGRVVDNHATAAVARRMHRQIPMWISYGDKSVATLRALVTAIERQFTIVPPPEELRVAWAEMIDVLALGPHPSCGRARPAARSACERRRGAFAAGRPCRCFHPKTRGRC